MTRKARILFVSLSILVLGGAFASLIVFYDKQDEETLPVVAKSERADIEISPIPFNIDEDLRELGSYLISQKTEEGYNNFLAHFDELCGENAESCPFGETNVLPLNNSWSAFAFYSVAVELEDEQYRERSLEDMRLVNEYCNQEERMPECLWVVAQPALMYREIQDPILVDFVRRASDELLVNEGQDHLMLRSIEARQLALAYEITGEGRYLEESRERLALAKVNFDQSLRSDNTNLQGANPAQLCWYSLAAAEIANQTGEMDDILALDNVLLSSELQTRITSHSNAFSVEPCIESLLLAAKVMEERVYFNEAVYLLADFREDSWDSREANLVWGEGGVLSSRQGTIEDPNLNRQVNITDTAYYAYLLHLTNEIKEIL